jgi:hypothetical protein
MDFSLHCNIQKAAIAWNQPLTAIQRQVKNAWSFTSNTTKYLIIKFNFEQTFSIILEVNCYMLIDQQCIELNSVYKIPSYLPNTGFCGPQPNTAIINGTTHLHKHYS